MSLLCQQDAKTETSDIGDENRPAAQKPMTSLNCEAEEAGCCCEQEPGENGEFRGNAIDLCC